MSTCHPLAKVTQFYNNNLFTKCLNDNLFKIFFPTNLFCKMYTQKTQSIIIGYYYCYYY